MSLRNFISPHVHQMSFDSASTPTEFAEKEIELGTGALVCTDHGFMGANSEVYDLAKKHKLTPILGIEAYLRDDNCPILEKRGIEKEKGGYSHYSKYCHFCMHAMDETAHNQLSIRLSDAFSDRGERHGSEIKPIWTWADVEHLGQYNVTASAGCLIGIASRHLMNGRADIAEDYYTKMRGSVKPGNFIVEIFPHDCSTYYEKGVFLTFSDGTKSKYSTTKKLRINLDGKELELPAADFDSGFHKFKTQPTLIAYKHYQKWIDLEPKTVTACLSIEGFIENPCTEWAGGTDYQRGANLFMMRMAEKYGDKILLSDDAHFTDPSQHEIQTMKLTSSGGNWRFPLSYHRQTSQEAFNFLSSTLGISEKTFEGWVDNSYEFRDKFKDFKFTDKIQLPTSRYPTDTVAHLKKLIEKHGRMRWNDPAWVARLKQEITLFRDNGKQDLLPYFFLAEECVYQYVKQRKLPGPLRGSSGGSAIAFLLGITHLDPIKHNLSIDRFITLDRIQSDKWPDVDMDFGDPDFFKHPETGWLFTEFGERAAAIATKTTMRLKSTIKDAMRSRYGEVAYDIQVLCKNLPDPPQGVTDEDFLWGYVSEDEKEVKGLWEESKPLREFAEREPQVWEVVKKAIGLTKGFSRHASAFLVSEIPIKEFIPTMVVSGVRTTQYNMTGVEARGGLKMDFLGLSTLNDLEDCINSVQARTTGLITEAATLDEIKVPAHFLVPFKKQLHSIWDLPEEVEVFRDLCRGDTETVFQLSTASAIKWLREFKNPLEDGTPAINTKEGIATFTALDRPGPLDAFVQTDDEKQINMLQEYARRARGMEPTGEIKALSSLLKESFGILIFQESLQRVYQELTGCDGIKATEFRTNIAKKKMDKVEAAYPFFMENASPKVGRAEAEKIFQNLKVFGRYGFCRAHARGYGEIAYACAFLKHYYPLEWWTAVLKNAKKDKIIEKLWSHASHMVLPPDVQLSGEFFQIEGTKIRAPLSFLKGVGEKAHEELVRGRPYADFKDFADRTLQTKLKGAKPKLEDGQPVIDKKTGLVKMVAGRSAVGQTMVFKLIAVGAMDSLFPPSTPNQKMEMYAQYLAEITAPKTRKKAVVAKIPPEWKNLDPLIQFQVSKQILPVHPQSLSEIVHGYSHLHLERREKDKQTAYIQHFKNQALADAMRAESLDLKPIRLLDGNQVRYFNDQFQIPEGSGRCLYGVYGYVLAERRFSFPKKAPREEQKDALSLTFDSCGETFDMVKWPDRKTEQLTAPSEDLTGSVCFFVVSRYTNSKPAVIEMIYVLKPKLEKSKDESDTNGSTIPVIESTEAGSDASVDGASQLAP